LLGDSIPELRAVASCTFYCTASETTAACSARSPGTLRSKSDASSDTRDDYPAYRYDLGRGPDSVLPAAEPVGGVEMIGHWRLV
jgi:hypothetical protein